MAVYITDALLEDIEADNGAKYSTLVTALVAEIRRLQKQLAPVETPAAQSYALGSAIETPAGSAVIVDAFYASYWDGSYTGAYTSFQPRPHSRTPNVIVVRGDTLAAFKVGNDGTLTAMDCIEIVTPEKPAAKAGMFGKVEQDWIKKDFVATWYEGDSVRRQASGFATRAEANRFLKGKGVTVYPLRTFNKQIAFRS